MVIESITVLKALESAIAFGYWAIGGAVGIAVITLVHDFLFKRKTAKMLKEIKAQNKEILEGMKRKKK